MFRNVYRPISTPPIAMMLQSTFLKTDIPCNHLITLAIEIRAFDFPSTAISDSWTKEPDAEVLEMLVFLKAQQTPQNDARCVKNCN